MNYNFNKKLTEQVKAGTHCIEFNREKDSLEMLQALCLYTWPNTHVPCGNYMYYFNCIDFKGEWTFSNQTNKTPIPLSNFVQPEQSDRDVMAELDEKIAKLEKMGAFEMLDFICSPTMSQRLAKLLNGEFKETPNDNSKLVGERTGFSVKFIKQPEPKWTPKVGEWFYITKHTMWLCEEVKDCFLGNDQNGNKEWFVPSLTFNKPTDKEVEDYMVGLAKEKGFVEGVKFNWGSVNDIRTVSEWIAYDKVNDCLHSKDYVIWNGGVWAEIVNSVRWRAERGGYYFVVTSQLKATSVIENYGTLNNEHFEQGNYYREIEQAEEMAVLMQFTLNNPELVKQLMTKKE